MRGVLVDNGDPAAGFDDAADLGNRDIDFDCVLERFGGIGGVEPGVFKGSNVIEPARV